MNDDTKKATLLELYAEVQLAYDEFLNKARDIDEKILKLKMEKLNLNQKDNQ